MRRAGLWRRAAAVGALLAATLTGGCGSDPPEYLVELDEHRFRADDDLRFAAPDFDDSDWQPVTLPFTWRVRTVDSEVHGWHRFRVRLPAVPSAPLAIDLGYIGWSDELFLNGQRIGGTGEMERLPRLGLRPRLYPVPDGVLRPGDNLLAVRVRGMPMVINGMISPRVAIGDRMELERAHGRELWATQFNEGLLLGFLLFAWPLVAFFPKRGRAGRATLFLLASVTLALIMLWLLALTFRSHGLSPEAGANWMLGTLSAAGACYWAFVGIVTRGTVPRAMFAAVVAELGVALMFLLVPGAFGGLLVAGLLVSTVALGLLCWYLGSAIRARTPGAVPIAVGCALAAVSVGAMTFAPSPFFHGIPLIHYGLLAAIAGAVLALTRHVAAMNRQVRRATEYALEAHTRERSRLARDLHDGLGQMLALLKLQMQRMGRMHRGEPVQQVFDESADQVGATLEELRRIARDLRPAPMQDRGFGEAVREYAAAIMQRTDLVVEVEGDYTDPPGDEVGDELYRITQECLTNCVKHSGAHRVVVTMSEVGDRLELRVADDGRGLSADIPLGLGLATIRERSELLGGTCEISTPTGGGTQVALSIPR